MFSFLTEPGTFACLYHTKRMSWDWGMETSSTVYPGPSDPDAWASVASVERQAAAQDGAEVPRMEFAATAARRGAMGATTATRWRSAPLAAAAARAQAMLGVRQLAAPPVRRAGAHQFSAQGRRDWPVALLAITHCATPESAFICHSVVGSEARLPGERPYTHARTHAQAHARLESVPGEWAQRIKQKPWPRSEPWQSPPEAAPCGPRSLPSQSRGCGRALLRVLGQAVSNSSGSDSCSQAGKTTVTQVAERPGIAPLQHRSVRWAVRELTFTDGNARAFPRLLVGQAREHPEDRRHPRVQPHPHDAVRNRVADVLEVHGRPLDQHPNADDSRYSVGPRLSSLERC